MDEDTGQNVTGRRERLTPGQPHTVSRTRETKTHIQSQRRRQRATACGGAGTQAARDPAGQGTGGVPERLLEGQAFGSWVTGLYCPVPRLKS